MKEPVGIGWVSCGQIFRRELSTDGQQLPGTVVPTSCGIQDIENKGKNGSSTVSTGPTTTGYFFYIHKQKQSSDCLDMKEKS
ncbi:MULTISPECIES: hypothetical protein [unclassified Wenzhouxiangella]|uniref:hypothetical protein n=1 Tax=unclassified Wenzhouxiangella TaxID=2613841 RepID=UPI0011C02802|nr:MULTISPECIES: hypothetical protein [unclassified Wenzhouxiangella]